MKLFYSANSPFVRKVLVIAHEAGLAQAIEIIPSAVGVGRRNAEIVAHNPLGQVPTLVTDDGRTIADSAVICEYLDALAGTGLFPAGEDRWAALTGQAMADGLMEAAVLWREENAARPAALQWPAFKDSLRVKIEAVTDAFEMHPPAGCVDIVAVALACALSYLDYRFRDEIDWRTGAPKLAAWYEAFAQRPAMLATRLGASA